MSAAVNGYLVSDLIGLALEQLGVGVGGQNADPAGATSGLMHLNMLLAQWQRRRWLVPNLVDRAFLSTGASVYRIGPGGDLDTPVRPAEIVSAYARLLNGAHPSISGQFYDPQFSPDFAVGDDGLSGLAQPIDYPLTLIPSYEDYAAIGLKGLRTWPTCCHYNPVYPFGEFRPWPISPAGVWEFHLLFAQPLTAGLALADTLNLPPEYWDAVMWCLAARLAPSYGQEASQTVIANARAALATIRSANLQIPTLGMPAALNSSSAPFWWPGLQTQRL